MKLIAFSRSFRDEVDPILLQLNDSDCPRFLFVRSYEDDVKRKFRSFCAIVEVDGVDAAVRFTDRMAPHYPDHVIPKIHKRE